MMRIQQWLWPTFVFVYPLIFVPWERDLLKGSYSFHIWATAIAVFVAVVGLWTSNPNSRLSDIKFLPAFLRANPPIALVGAFGLWGVLASFFTPSPAIALLGTIFQTGDGGLANLLFSGVFILVYLSLKKDGTAHHRIAFGFVASGVVLSVIALLEVILHRGLIYSVIVSDLPLAAFPQKGHLAGYLAAVLALTLVLFPAQKSRIFIGASSVLMAVALGLTTNRAAFLGLLIVVAWIILKDYRKYWFVTLLVCVGLGIGISFSKQSGTDGNKEYASANTIETRNLFWKAAFRGIMARPVFGWGGGNFDSYWAYYLTPAEQEVYLQKEMQVFKVDKLVSGPGSFPLWIVENAKGEKHSQSVVLWKSHNQFLEVALQRGLVGLLMFLGILSFALRPAVALQPASLGVWTYCLFFMFWFVMFYSEGAFWVMLALAAFESTKPQQT